MKRIITLFSLLIFSLITYSQSSQIIARAQASENISKDIPAGSEIHIIEVGSRNSVDDHFLVEFNGKTHSISPNKYDLINNLTFDNLTMLWEFQKQRSDDRFGYSKKYPKQSIRHLLDENSKEFIKMLEDYDLFYNDDFITDYLYQLVSEILNPTVKVDSRNSIVVKIMKDSSPNAFMCTNGTLVISSGLITLMESEDELVGVLSHEIAHFVLNHAVNSFGENQILEDKAMIWAGIATAIAAMAEGAMAANNEYYIPGNITSSVMVLSYSIAEHAIEELGQRYQRYQEVEADICARQMLSFLGRDPSAYTAVLSRLRDYDLEIGNQYAFSDKGTHPSINDRINDGEPISALEDYYQTGYNKMISSLSTYVANLELTAGHFKNCLSLSADNINEGVGIEEDYLLLAKSLMCISNSDSSNNAALTHLKTGLSLGIEYIPELDKQLALLYLRMNEKSNAEIHLDEYIAQVESRLENSDWINNEAVWAYFQQYYQEELSWAKRLKYKMDKL